MWRIDSGVDAIDQLDSEKNVAMFSSIGVFSERELQARKSVLLTYYTGVVEMEALTMIDMINKHVIPSVKKSDVGQPEQVERRHQANQIRVEEDSRRRKRNETSPNGEILAFGNHGGCP